MNEKLQAERDLRARIKTRLEHGCMFTYCQEHGPADAADIMLVSYIYQAELTRNKQPTAIEGVSIVVEETSPEKKNPTRLDIPHCGSWKELAHQLAEVWWWCHNNNANLQHGELSSETCTFSICLMGGVPGPNTFHADTPVKVMEQAKARLAELPQCYKCKTSMRFSEENDRWTCVTCDYCLFGLEHTGRLGEPAAPSHHKERVQLLQDPTPLEFKSGFEKEEARMKDLMRKGLECEAQIETLTKELDEARRYGEQQGRNSFLADRWASDVIEQHSIQLARDEEPLAAIARHINFLKDKSEKLQGEVDAIFNILRADSPCKVKSCRLVSEDVKDLVDFMEGTKAENEELGRFLIEHGAQEGENLIQLIVRKDRMLWELIQALSPFYLFATVYEGRYDILTNVLTHKHQGLCVGAFQTARETLSEVLKSCPPKNAPTA